jgi:hypothetical protein
MTALANFGELASVKANTVERPKALPEGHYIAQFSGPMTQHKAKSGNIAMRFPFKLLSAGEDVDQEEVAAAGGLPDKTYNLDFWMSPEARYRFTDFACGAQGLSDDMSLIELAEQLLAEAKPFSIQNKPQQDENDPKIWYNRWDNPSAAE